MPQKPRRRCVAIRPTDVYTISQLTSLLDLNPETIRRERKLGRLRTSQRAHRVYILGEWVLEWLRSGEVVSRREAA